MTKIIFYSSSRADFGIQSQLILRALESENVEARLVITGSHVQGGDYNSREEIRAIGIPIDEEIPYELIDDLSNERVVAAAKIMPAMGNYLMAEKPDMVVVLGDRFELVPAVLAAVLNNVKVAHIHGGELSFGSQDEYFRHAITKLSDLHFVSTSRYRERVIQMGESPERVFFSGSMAVESIVNFPFWTADHFNKEIGSKKGDTNILVTFHPVSSDIRISEREATEFFSALDILSKEFILHVSMPNNDLGFDFINQKIRMIENNKNVRLYHNMGRVLYYNSLKHMDCMVGNSSSGIIEGPAAGLASINVGSRQAGREMPKSVICVPSQREVIVKSVKKGLKSRKGNPMGKVDSPYFKPNSSQFILETIQAFCSQHSSQKVFYDLG